MTPQRGQTGPCGHRTRSRWARAASSSWKIGLRRSTFLPAIAGAPQFRNDPTSWGWVRQADNSPIAGSPRADGFTGFMFLAAVAMYLTGFGMRRHVKAANRPQQVISLNCLLGNPRFSIYAFDNATAKAIDSELRGILTNIKGGLVENARIAEPETFEL